jgi:hypothetical protein
MVNRWEIVPNLSDLVRLRRWAMACQLNCWEARIGLPPGTKIVGNAETTLPLDTAPLYTHDNFDRSRVTQFS